MFETLTLKNGVGLRIIGAPPLILSKQYDLRQLWLSFIAAVVMLPPSKPARSSLPAVQSGRPSRDTAMRRPKIEPHDRQMYVHQKGVQQHVLPFREFRRVSNSEFDRLATFDFPGWERMPEGSVATYGNRSRGKADLLSWCEEHCTGRFHVSASRVGFASLDDACVAILMFGQQLITTD